MRFKLLQFYNYVVTAVKAGILKQKDKNESEINKGKSKI